MSAILVMFGGKLAAWAFGLVGVGGIWMLAKKMLPGMVAKYVGQHLKDFLNVSDPADKMLVKALIIWAETKKPDAGKGAEKFAMVMGKMQGIFHITDENMSQAKELIEEIFKAAESELSKAAEDAKNAR